MKKTLKMAANRIRAEGAASRLLEKYGYSAPNELILEDLAFALGVEVRRHPMDSLEGCLYRVGNRGIIQINSRAIPNRQRFSLAHEIGHWELHPNLRQKSCSDQDMIDYYRSSEEIEANHFAASLLLPRQWIPVQLLKADPSFAQIKILANLLRVSLACSARRFVELTPQPVVLVLSRKGKVDWSVTSNKAKYFWVEKGFQVHKFTSTFECITQNEQRRHLEEVEGSYWYPEKELSDDFEIFEDVWNFQKFGYCLTLLWVASLF